MSAAALSYITARIHAGRHVEGDFRFLAGISLAFAVRALFRDDLARAAAIGAYALADRSAEHRVLHALHHAFAAAPRARFKRRAVFRARAFAAFARRIPHVRNRFSATFRRVHKRKSHFFLYIFADFRLRRAARARAATAEPRKSAAEKAAEYIFETAETAAVAAAEPRKSAETARAHARVFKLEIVLFAFLRIGKRFVRFVDLFEFFCGCRIAGVQIGVILLRELSVRRFDLVRARRFAYAENFIIIFLAFRHNFFSLCFFISL